MSNSYGFEIWPADTKTGTMDEIINVFSNRYAPEGHLVQAWNEFYAYPGPPDWKDALMFTLLRYALSTCPRNGYIALTGFFFFGYRHSQLTNLLTRILRSQGWSMVSRIISHQDPHYMCQLTSHVLRKQFCEKKVYYYIKYIYRTTDPDLGQHRREECDRLDQADQVFVSLIVPESYLSYLCKDLREYIIRPYLKHFYRYI